EQRRLRRQRPEHLPERRGHLWLRRSDPSELPGERRRHAEPKLQRWLLRRRMSDGWDYRCSGLRVLRAGLALDPLPRELGMRRISNDVWDDGRPWNCPV